MGRSTMGAKHPCAKLTEEQVQEIRDKWKMGEKSQTALAEEYGVTQPTVHEIVSNKAWRHLLNLKGLNGIQG